MAKTRGRMNVLRESLNVILASEGHVRVLRELFAHGGELSPPDIAFRARLSEQQVRRILPLLVAMGVVTAVGLGRYRLYRVRGDGYFHDALTTLFMAEECRFSELLEAIRRAARDTSPQPEAVWLYGSVARHEDRVDSDVDVILVFADEPVEMRTTAVREALNATEERLSVCLSVLGLGPADVNRLIEGDPFWNSVRQDAFPLLGPPPDVFARRLSRRRAL